MIKKEIITITGPNACGKTTVTSLLLEFLPGYQSFSTGAIAREMAAAVGMDIGKYVQHARATGIPLDKTLDDALMDLNNSSKRIVDSRLGALFIPDSFKVYLDVNSWVAAERRLRELQEKDWEKYKDWTLEMMHEELEKRNNHDQREYQNLYGINYRDLSRYNLVIKTEAEKNPNFIASKIDMKYRAWLKQHNIQLV